MKLLNFVIIIILLLSSMGYAVEEEVEDTGELSIRDEQFIETIEEGIMEDAMFDMPEIKPLPFTELGE